MHQNRHWFVSRILWMVALLAGATATAVAQHTVVKDAGGGRKMELVYDAAGQVTEQRMLGADGKVMQKTEYEHRPGFYQPQEVVTSYWPNGEIKTVTRTSYDANSNFTLEFAQIFDESGKQIGGHRLTHDPEINVYHCYEWNVAAQHYKEIQCPAGEAGGGEGPEEVKRYSYDEVVKHLEAARKAAQQEQKMRQRRPAMPEPVQPTIVSKEVGLVLPAQIGSGDKFSGSVVSDRKQYDDVPGVKVFQVNLPFTSTGTGSSLMDWEVVTSDGKPQRADGPVILALPGGSSEVKVTFQQAGSPVTAVSKVLNLAEARSRPQTTSSFKAAALCMKGQLCTVSGPFSGDSSKTFAAFDDRPATIVAETRNMAYISIPERIAPGAPSLFLAEGAKVVALPVVVAEFSLDQGRDFSKGQARALNVRLEGPSELPELEWRAGNFPPANLAQARKFVPGFELPRESGQARERGEARQKQESKQTSKREPETEEGGGEILLVVENVAPEQVTLRGSKNGIFVFRLHKGSFARGGFSYDFVAEAKQPGNFAVKGYVIPFLAPVDGQEFTVKGTGQ